MTVEDWLLDSDPALRWQVMRDLTGASEADVGAERARVASEGWGARLLALQAPNGQWGGGTLFPVWTSTAWTLMLLYHFGLDPASTQARHAVALVRENSRWEHDGQPFFSGEVEPCINGRTVAIGTYFGEDVGAIVDRLVDEQVADGGWNCEQENGSTRGSFHSTICVLEGLLEYERAAGGSPAVTAARERGEAYLLDRRLLRRLSTGEVIEPSWRLRRRRAGLRRRRRRRSRRSRSTSRGVLRVTADQTSASMGVRSSGRRSGRIRRKRTACRHRLP
ncbi:hypothetical protein ABN034_28795 [Actinopolymorpha sp. B11F2]|uniref:hypothetical protein n=1 Tax=Actinopolymorpha sp. B11F2 TaxID=3160862 RepID=UPI0032E3C61B